MILMTALSRCLWHSVLVCSKSHIDIYVSKLETSLNQ